MNQQQLDYLKSVAVTAHYGPIVTDKHGGVHTIRPEDMTVEMAGWLYSIGLTGPSPGLGQKLLDRAMDRDEQLEV